MSHQVQRRLALTRLRITQFRNLDSLRIEPCPGVNVISGNNGAGKTSILEAIYFAATSRSFRTSRLQELVNHAASGAGVSARFAEQWPTGPLVREQSATLAHGTRTLKLDGAEPATVAHYATRSPVVVFEPKQLAMTMGPASERRTLLDRVTLYTEPSVHAHRARYRRALKERQLLLADRSRVEQRPELDAFETLLAEHGAHITAARQRAVEALVPPLLDAFAAIAPPGLVLAVRYVPGGGLDRAELCARLHAARRLDAQKKRASVGPQSDEVLLTLDGHPARVVASQGQHRALTLALKTAELLVVGQASGLSPMLLLDDVSSELDPDRTAALFELLGTTESQLFLTTTRPELILSEPRLALTRREFELADGAVRERS
ncbi:MAG: DNA replication and repair protein RecF [Myxococcales bacterium]|nr:DNA replication and repair protein RecF [Myxococcales bacterium]